MTSLNHVLVGLLEHIESTSASVTIDYYHVQKWPVGALNRFLALGLITPISAAQSIECRACDNRCFMDVLIQTNDNKSLIRAFIVCDDAEMQPQMGRMKIPLDHLQQWQSSTNHLAKVISCLLGLNNGIKLKIASDKIQLGMMKSSKGRCWVSLIYRPLFLDVNQHTIPLSELLYFENEELQIDLFRVKELLDKPARNRNKKYIPSGNKREARKLETEAMHQDWRDEYIKLKKTHPDHFGTWYSKKIAKMTIAQGRDSETIRKNMKN